MRRDFDLGVRLFGLLPWFCFVGQTIHYWRFGGLGNLLWMCNAGNLLLAAGLFLGHRELIRAAALWTIPGLVIWIWYVARDANLSSRLAHVGGILVGMIAWRRVRMDGVAWRYAFAWSLFLQIVARLFTDPALNVNLAHSIQPGWEGVFSSYWKFRLTLTLLIALMLWLLGRALHWLWPATDQFVKENSQVA